jgi:hypothetical protein
MTDNLNNDEVMLALADVFTELQKLQTVLTECCGHGGFDECERVILTRELQAIRDRVKHIATSYDPAAYNAALVEALETQQATSH